MSDLVDIFVFQISSLICLEMRKRSEAHAVCMVNTQEDCLFCQAWTWNLDRWMVDRNSWYVIAVLDQVTGWSFVSEACETVCHHIFGAPKNHEKYSAL